MNGIDKIEPLFFIDDEMKSLIKVINQKLKRIDVDDEQRKEYLISKSRVRSIHSSLAIEANSLSLFEVSMISKDNIVHGSTREVTEVKNAIELYNEIEEYDYKSENDLLSAHKVMMNLLTNDSGKYRKHGEAVKDGDEIIYIAPDSIIVPSLMKSLFEYINDSKDNLMLLSIIFHYYFVVIHPFSDGNGRIARFWSSLMLIKYNENFKFIPIEEDIYLSQKDYYDAIRKCHVNGNANEFIKYMLKVIKSSIDRVNYINDHILNYYQFRILELIAYDKNITQQEIAKKLKISIRTVKRHFKTLMLNEFISRVGSSKNGHWEIIVI